MIKPWTVLVSENIAAGFVCLSLLIIVTACTCGSLGTGEQPGAGSPTNASRSDPPESAPASPAVSAKKAYHISGNIDEALQEGDVCDTSVKFEVPGTLKFEFTPETPAKGQYTYSGPFNATGSGPYEIRDDGSMFLDGTGCIMGKCATYSHEWKAKPVDPAQCKPGK